MWRVGDIRFLCRWLVTSSDKALPPGESEVTLPDQASMLPEKYHAKSQMCWDIKVSAPPTSRDPMNLSTLVWHFLLMRMLSSDTFLTRTLTRKILVKGHSNRKCKLRLFQHELVKSSEVVMYRTILCIELPFFISFFQSTISLKINTSS